MLGTMLKDMRKVWNTAIIVAAGSGSRLGSEIPKQFQLLAGQEILAYSVQRFLDHPRIQSVVVVTAAHYVERVSHAYPRCQVVAGGASRQDSVALGLAACPTGTRQVLVHDAARPLVSNRVIDDCLQAMEGWEGVAPALPVNDSMIRLEDTGFINLDRDRLRIIQTPQCFKFDLLLQAQTSGKVDTDELGLVRQVFPGARLTLVEGEASLMKITRPMDLEIISHYLEGAQ